MLFALEGAGCVRWREFVVCIEGSWLFALIGAGCLH